MIIVVPVSCRERKKRPRASTWSTLRKKFHAGISNINASSVRDTVPIPRMHPLLRQRGMKFVSVSMEFR